MKAVVLIGIPGSGKSTLAHGLVGQGYTLVSADQVREFLYGDASIQGNGAEVWEWFYLDLDSHLNSSCDVVVDNTNVRSRDRKVLLEYFIRFGYTVEYWLVDTPLEIALERNSKRDRKVPEEVIVRMSNTLKENKSLLRAECERVITIK